MTYQRKVSDVDGGTWTLTLPDQVTISQGNLSNLVLNGNSNNPALVFDYNFDTNILFGSNFNNGAIDIGITEDNPASPNSLNSTNGLRGKIEFHFHNNLGIQIRDPLDAPAIQLSVRGISDSFPLTNEFHSVYTHFHPASTAAIDSTEFPGLKVTPSIVTVNGKYAGNEDPAKTPNTISIDSTINPGDYIWSDITFHRRDLEGSDNAVLSLKIFDENLRPQWLALNSLGEVKTGHSNTLWSKISHANESDFYSIKLIKGQTYTFDLKDPRSPPYIDPFLRLLDRDGTELTYNDNFHGLNSKIEYTAGHTGMFYIEAGQKGGTVGPYVLEIAARQSVQDLDGNWLFNTTYYLETNPDVLAAGLNPIDHYNTYGWHEGRDPNAYFSTKGYLGAHPDVAAAGINPLTHFDQYGWKDGRDPSANFDVELYLTRNPDVKASGINPLTHYLQYGQAEGREAYAAIDRAPNLAIHPGFDAEYYLLSNTDVVEAAQAAGNDTFNFAYQHYKNYGWHEGRNPNAVFDTKGYLSTYADVKAANIDPLMHYDQYGFKEGRDPSAGFDTKEYVSHYTDVKAAGLDPMLHYLQYGALEGRSTFADGHFG